MDLDLLKPQALHINRLPDRLHVGVLVVPHSAHTYEASQAVDRLTFTICLNLYAMMCEQLSQVRIVTAGEIYIQ